MSESVYFSLSLFRKNKRVKPNKQAKKKKKIQELPFMIESKDMAKNCK